MGIKFECDLTGEIWEEESIGVDVLPVTLQVRSKAARQGFAEVGKFCISRDEVPDKLDEDIDELGSTDTAEIDVMLSGAMIPSRINSDIKYLYKEENPDILSISLVVISVKNSGTSLARTHSYDTDEFDEFLDRVDNIIPEQIETSVTMPDPNSQEKNPPSSRGFR